MSRVARFALGDQGRVERNDRILPVTRIIGAIIAPILLGAFIILYLVPHQTSAWFAWTIQPSITAMIMGAGYGTGVYFFYRVVTAGEWHRVDPVFPGIAVFTWFMAAATALHWANFNHDHVAFYLWTVLYIASPLVVPGVWILNRRFRSIEWNGAESFLPIGIRWIGGVSGGAIVGIAAVCFLVPDLMIDPWPWTITPLTARILLGWFALLGVVNLVLYFDPRWTAWRLAMECQIIGLSLVLLGAVRGWDDFDPGNPYTWVMLGGMVAYLIGVSAFYGIMSFPRVNARTE